MDAQRRWSDHEMLSSLAAAATEVGDQLRVEAYLLWIDANPGRHATAGQISRRFNGWPRALRLAGLDDTGLL